MARSAALAILIVSASPALSQGVMGEPFSATSMIVDVAQGGEQSAAQNVRRNVLTEGQVRRFVDEALVSIFTISPQNAKSVISRSHKFFSSPEGINGFEKAVHGSGMLSFIETNGVNLTIGDFGDFDLEKGMNAIGDELWTVRVPALFSFRSSKSSLDHDGRVMGRDEQVLITVTVMSAVDESTQRPEISRILVVSRND